MILLIYFYTNDFIYRIQVQLEAGLINQYLKNVKVLINRTKAGSNIVFFFLIL